MSNNQDGRSLWPQYIVCYAALAVIAVLGVLLMQAMTLAVSSVGLYFGFYRYTMTVINQFGILFLGIFWLIGFFAVEAYLRNGVKARQLWPRVGKVLAWELGLLMLAFVLQSLPES